MIDSTTLRESYDRIYAEGGIRADDPGFYNWILRILEPARGRKLLDVACGEGYLLVEAARAGLEVAGLDISPKAIAFAKILAPHAEAVAGEAEHLPWPDARFDYVTCLGSLENMINPRKALAEISRVAKREALVCVQVPNIYWLGDVVESLYRRTPPPPFQEINRWGTRLQWRVFLGEGGLEVVREFRYNNPALLIRNGKVRSLKKFVVRSLLNAVTPLNLSWSFVYLFRKMGGGEGGSEGVDLPKEYWLYEARQLKVKPGRLGLEG